MKEPNRTNPQERIPRGMVAAKRNIALTEEDDEWLIAESNRTGVSINLLISRMILRMRSEQDDPIKDRLDFLLDPNRWEGSTIGHDVNGHPALVKSYRLKREITREQMDWLRGKTELRAKGWINE